VAPDTLATKDIYRGVLPFILIQIGILFVLALFPELVTALPEAVYGN
jgi:TRAP-type mannitol/chloroaromatic compound transport system permease large subunit